MLDRSQWIAIGLVSGFAYILGKDRESFEAPYSGSGSLMGIKQDTSIGDFSTKELTESSAIHGDFNEASLNYSGHQNIQVRGAESFEAEDVEGMKDIWWAYKIDDEDWKDYTRYKRKHKNFDWSEKVMFVEWIHEKSWENDEDIRYHLRFFDNPKSAQKFIGRTKVIYDDEGEPEDVEFIRVYGKVNNEDLDHALTFPREGVFNPYIQYPLLLGGNIASEMDKRAAETFGAEKKNCGCGQDPCVTYGAEPCESESFEADDFTKLPKPRDDMRYEYGDLKCINCGSIKIENLRQIDAPKFCDRWSEKPKGECASKPDSVRVVNKDRDLMERINKTIYPHLTE